MKQKAALLLAIAIGLSGCGLLGPKGPLEETTDRLGDIRSGNLSFKLSAATRGGAETGFELKGPFSIPSGAALPTARLDYRRLGVPGSRPSTFISTDKTAYIEVGGRAYQLPPDQVSGLRGSRDAQGGPFETLDISGWVDKPRVTRGPKIDGAQTNVIRGDLEVVAALNDLFGLAREFGSSNLPQLGQKDQKHLEEAVKSARIEVITGRSDSLLRRLSMVVDLGAEGPKRLSPKLRNLLGVNFRLEMAISDPNRPINVATPKNALPFSRLESRSG